MAGNKSSEGKLTTLECMECGFREVFTERQFKTADGLRCYVCDGLVRPTLTKPDEPIRNRRMKSAKNKFRHLYGKNEIRLSGTDFASDKDKSVLGIRVDIDCSDAIKGLKAVQREARKASAAMKELEEQQKKVIHHD